MSDIFTSPVPTSQLKNYISQHAKRHISFFFIINFDKSEGYFLPQQLFNQTKILFSFPRFANQTVLTTINKQNHHLEVTRKVNYTTYQQQFMELQREFQKGHTFLVNLTQSTDIETNLSLKQIFDTSQAKYKIYLQDKFVCFSPETFITISPTGKISTYPMKGTINADEPNARKRLEQDNKEIAEHGTIVDLMRNDLNQVATKITVENFRYFEHISTQQRNIYQTSSMISGQLPSDYLNHLDDIIFRLLPAGSISGAPKKSTVQIIKRVENHDRGYYTGIAGFFDGTSLDTCVLIRFIEKQKNQLVYKSGGGINIYSDAKKEYVELLEKIYLPIQNSE